MHQPSPATACRPNLDQHELALHVALIGDVLHVPHIHQLGNLLGQVGHRGIGAGSHNGEQGLHGAGTVCVCVCVVGEA